MTYPRGSEWGRWDLHVHTPDSLVQNYGRGGVDPWPAFLDDLEQLPTDFRVLGVNDYLFLDGYRKLRKFKEDDGRLKNIELVLPVIELRLNHFGGADGQLSRVNLHVIFSNELDADVVQAQFINGLKCDLDLVPDGPAKTKWASLPTRASLAELGAELKASLPDDQRRNAGSDLKEGFNSFNVTFDSVIGLLEGNPIFDNRCFLAVGKTEWADVKWTKQSAAYKRTLINKPHWVFTAAATPAAFTKSREALINAGVNATLLDCSDAHHLSTSGQPNRIGNCMTWINAIPTFEGLRHAYHEYDTRVYVGDLPPKLQSARSQSTHHVKSVAVEPVHTADPRPVFNVDVPLNSGFVAIVGNKGRGKSALTDVVGLVGGSQRAEYYSFLNRRRFRDPRANLAAKHTGSLTWVSGAEVSMSLDEDPDPAATEAVQYLPQNFLETVCNEGPGTDALFSAELGDVIFSHVPEASRLGATSLNELIDARTDATKRRMGILRGELSSTILQIRELEQQLKPEAKRHLKNMLDAKEAELDAHIEQEPPEVKAPSENDEDTGDLEGKIEVVRANITVLEAEIRRIQDDANRTTLLLERANGLRKELENLDHQVNTFTTRLQPVAAELGLDLGRLVTVTFDRFELDQRMLDLVAAQGAANASLNIAEDGSPAQQAEVAKATLADLESALDAPQRAYQNYLSQLSEWERLRLEIVGTPHTPDTIEHYRARLEYLDRAPAQLAELRELRMQQALEIHGQLVEMAEKLREIYAPVQRFIENHPVVRDRFNLSFSVTIVEDRLAERLFAMLNRQVNGSFAGMDEGSARLEDAVARTSFDDPEDVRAFLNSIDDDLRHDNRPGRSGKSTNLTDQLRKGASGHGLYELVFGLDYLRPEFWLRSDEMPISQLSPGQRGTLLLLFYLLIDKSARPIILDQPEENLDNQTVHELLVPAIAVARRSRQVIAVTHNPNLAVVGDADQVIIAEMTSGAFEYVSGAIEDPQINTRIVDILEGTWPAFQNRHDKYTPTSVLDRTRRLATDGASDRSERR